METTTTATNENWDDQWWELLQPIRREARCNTNLANMLETLMGPGKIVTCVMTDSSADPGDTGVPELPEKLYNKPMKWAKAKPYLNYPYDQGFGSTRRPRTLRVWSETHVGYIGFLHGDAPILVRLPLQPEPFDATQTHEMHVAVLEQNRQTTAEAAGHAIDIFENALLENPQLLKTAAAAAKSQEKTG